jgi:hypothetical protein
MHQPVEALDKEKECKHGAKGNIKLVPEDGERKK